MSARDDAAVELAAECVYVVRVFLVAEQHGICGREVREVIGLQRGRRGRTRWAREKNGSSVSKMAAAVAEAAVEPKRHHDAG